MWDVLFIFKFILYLTLTLKMQDLFKAETQGFFFQNCQQPPNVLFCESLSPLEHDSNLWKVQGVKTSQIIVCCLALESILGIWSGWMWAVICFQKLKISKLKIHALQIKRLISDIYTLGLPRMKQNLKNVPKVLFVLRHTFSTGSLIML